ncbi:hypothetical protein [Streptomyces venezuelae]|uniref:hypothetical protein n=1 Tax=Streptomyces venezuelae TaxID=54571 RepID=UPI00168025F8|nr:hypothetical protein [Streptomyces venezuelae]
MYRSLNRSKSCPEPGSGVFAEFAGLEGGLVVDADDVAVRVAEVEHALAGVVGVGVLDDFRVPGDAVV